MMEFWEPDDHARQLLESGADVSELRKAALDAGFRSMMEHATRLALEGVTTLEELRAVVPYEHIARYRGSLRLPPVREVTAA
jgi:type II secretory ATPase GspE/PulE/Tfp pilus assembly ATPase PilB-like protein